MDERLMQPVSIVEDFKKMENRRDAVVTELMLVRLGRVLPPLIGGMHQAGVAFVAQAAWCTAVIAVRVDNFGRRYRIGIRRGADPLLLREVISNLAATPEHATAHPLAGVADLPYSRCGVYKGGAAAAGLRRGRSHPVRGPTGGSPLRDRWCVRAIRGRLGIDVHLRMRILHVAPEYTPCIGGSITYIQALSERLASRGHQVTVVTQRRSSHLDHDDDPSLPRRQVLRGVRVCRLPRGDRRVWVLERLATVRGTWRLLQACFGARGVEMLFDRIWSPGLLALALRSRWDVAGVINLGEPVWAHPAFVAGRVQGFPLVGIPLLHTEEPWSRRPLIAELLRRCDALLVNTEHEKAFVVARGCLPDRTHVAGVGIEPSDFARPDGEGLRSRLGIGDAPLVGFVGRLEESKGVVTVIRAMKTVWAGIPRATLLLAGHQLPPRSPDAQKVESALAALSADEHDRVIMLDGFAEADKASIFGALDVLAMPSVVESFGIVYLEAWACSKPVIGARTAAVECVIDHGRDGLLVPPHDAGATAAAIGTLLADTGLRERLGRAGRDKVLSRFTWDTVTNHVERVYRDLAAGRGSGPASARQ